MKKYLIVIGIFLAISSRAQDSHFALTFGPSIPLADYASTGDFYTNGYANPGFNLSFSGNYIPTWYFGIGGTLAFSNNLPNQDSMLNDYIKVLRDMDIPPIPETVDKSVSIGSWSCVNMLVGPTVALPVGDRLQFNFKAFLGFSVIIPPNQSITLYYDDTNIYSYFETQTVNFCYSLGTDIIWKLRGNYSLMLGADYTQTKTNYDVDLTIEDMEIPPISRTVDIQYLNTYIGFAFLF